MTDRELLHRIERSAGQRAGYKQLVRELGLGGGRERRMLVEQLDRMTARGELVKSDRDHWALPQAAARNNLVAGRLDVHRDGFGFVRPETRQAGGDDDIFIPPNEMNGAMQGDQVLVELAPPRADGRRSGRIARVLSRRNPTVVGIFHYALHEHAQGNTVTPLDERMTQPILIPFGLEQAPATGGGTPHRVVSERYQGSPHRSVSRRLRVWRAWWWTWRSPTGPRPPVPPAAASSRSWAGKTISASTSKSSSASIICPMFSRPMFSTRRAPPLTWIEEEVARRRDFRDLPIVTIDGETAKDFDDAVFVRQHGGAVWELQVHIADVAQYVTARFGARSRSALARHLRLFSRSRRPHAAAGAFQRYLQPASGGGPPGSLLHHDDRSGRRDSQLRGDPGRHPLGAPHDLHPGARRHQRRSRTHASNSLRWFRNSNGCMSWRACCNRKRQRRGSIDFDLPEPVIEFDSQGAMQSIVRSERSWANRLIEEFMLSANECVASWLQNLDVPSLYRIHEKPEPRRVVEFETVAAGFGYSLGLGPLPVKRMTMKSERREQRGRAAGPGPPAPPV